MNEIDLQRHADSLTILLRTMRGAKITIAALAFCAYGLAMWLWYRDAAWYALAVATIGYLAFRLMSPFVYRWASWRLCVQPAGAEAIRWLEGQCERRPRRLVLAEITERLIDDARV